MPTNFPGSLDSYTTKVDGTDVVQAAHVNNLQDAMVAVQTKLGTGAAISVTRSAGTAIYALDSTSTGSSVTVGDLGVFLPFGSSFFRGLLMVYNASNGQVGLFFCDASGVVEVADRLSGFTPNTGGSGSNTINVYLDGSNYLTLENRYATSQTLHVTGFRIG